MRLPITLLALLLGTSTALAQSNQPRTFTDTQGRSLNATITTANQTHVQIRRTDGTPFTIPIDSLSADDQSYITKWFDDIIANAAQKLLIDTIRYKAKNPTNSLQQKFGFIISLDNKSTTDIDNLRIEYCLYYTIGLSNVPYRAITAQIINAPLVPKFSSKRFNTNTVDLYTHRTSNNDTLDGIWFRIYRKDIQILEYLSNESIRARGWRPPRSSSAPDPHLLEPISFITPSPSPQNSSP